MTIAGLSRNCKIQDRDLGVPATGEWLRVEERQLCVQLRSGLASLAVDSSRKGKIEEHSAA